MVTTPLSMPILYLRHRCGPSRNSVRGEARLIPPPGYPLVRRPQNTACRYSRGRNAGWRKQFILGMKDGATFDLMTWPAAAVRAYPEIAQALRGGDFSFDESGVALRCPQPYMGMLSHRP
jgi:hypothetical protein